MGLLTALLAVSAVLVFLACGFSGSLVLLHRGRQLRERERSFGVMTPHLQRISGGIGAASGLAIGGIVVYYLSLNQQVGIIEWIGRASYILVAGASGGHLLALAYAALGALREEAALRQEGGPGEGTLGDQRLRTLDKLNHRYSQYTDVKSRDEFAVEELVGVLGDALLATHRNLNRLPFYGYLGTICGILLMAQELSKINEATESFKVLSSMAHGLGMAFQTTLVALLAYLPLRKLADHLLQRIRRLEENWLKLREEGG